MRAAQLRAKAVRWALGKTFFGMLFFVGALAHALGPDPMASSSALWTALLLVLSTVNIGLGLRGFARVSARGSRLVVAGDPAVGALGHRDVAPGRRALRRKQE